MSKLGVTGSDLIAAGYRPGAWFKEALARINAAPDPLLMLGQVCQSLAPPEPVALYSAPQPYHVHLMADTGLERKQRDGLLASFNELMRTPTVVTGALMPDACEAGPAGTIPVGGVVVAERAIHPGMHSSDICCSMFVSVVEGVEPGDLLDAVQSITHFGPGGRVDGRFALSEAVLSRLSDNRFLGSEPSLKAAREHFGTAGDGNHFQSVGLWNNKVVLTSHHGSRGLGALLYKTGMKCAERYRLALSPETLPVNAWIPSESRDGEEYWEALQLVREWTKENHRVLHDAAIEALGGRVVDRFWNEHNFVFRKGDSYIHAKGATPVEQSFLPDSDGRMIVPFNATEPIAIIRGSTTATNLGFAPHGAGRFVSRNRHRRERLQGNATELEILQEETHGIDMRFYCGKIDITELPSAYKPASAIISAMERFGLAEVTDRIDPYGSIMAGDWEQDAPWRKSRQKVDGANHGTDSTD